MNDRARRAIGFALICGVVYVLAAAFLDDSPRVLIAALAALVGLGAVLVAAWNLIRG